MQKNHNWVKFYFKDWQLDVNLQSCSYGARGLWLELIGLMCRSDRYGYLELNGQPMTVTQIANFTNGHKQYVIRYLAELEKKGVLSKDENGVIYCRRLIKAVPERVAHPVTTSVTEPVTRSVTENGGRKPKNEHSPIYQNQNQNIYISPLSPKGEMPPHEKHIPVEEISSHPPKPKLQRGSRLPENWRLSDHNRDYALEQGLDPERTLEKFRDYWHSKTGQNATKLDWDATWRNWCRRETEYKNIHPFPGQNQRNQQPREKPHPLDWMVAEHKQQWGS